ncbi:hypothetical protein L208DRAFT_1376851 [Tricholoma matsutake]|nr:hypothetical protein L208DRAFT_1376851 [Tricholoma matsutake 945]
MDITRLIFNGYPVTRAQQLCLQVPTDLGIHTFKGVDDLCIEYWVPNTNPGPQVVDILTVAMLNYPFELPVQVRKEKGGGNRIAMVDGTCCGKPDDVQDRAESSISASELNTEEFLMLSVDAVPEWIIQEFAVTQDMTGRERSFNGYIQSAETFAKVFPHIFVDGYTLFDLSVPGQAQLMARWTISHRSRHFDNQVGFYRLLLETCQCDDVAMAMERLPEQLEGACWEVHLSFMKSLLANIVGGDTDCSVLHGESAGVCLRLGEPSFIISLEPDGSPVSTMQASSNLSKYFGRIVKAHKEIAGEQSPQEVAQKFERLICMFISCILHGENQEQGGLLGKTLTFLGKVEGREGTGLAFEMLLWVEEAI